MTAQELIRAALRDLGVLAAGETPTAEDMAHGLEGLQMLLQSWAAEDLMVYAETTGSGNLVASQGSYTIGATGADFTASRLDDLLRAYLRIDGVDSQLKAILSENYAELADKSTTGQPSRVYYKPNYPLGIFYLHPVPDRIYAFHWEGLVTPAAPTGLYENVNFPQEYNQAIRFNLAVDLAPSFGKQADAVLVGRAGECKANIKAKNLVKRMAPVRLELADMFRSSTRFNITVGE